jgi:hypothetical protein
MRRTCIDSSEKERHVTPIFTNRRINPWNTRQANKISFSSDFNILEMLKNVVPRQLLEKGREEGIRSTRVSISPEKEDSLFLIRA